LNSKTRIGQNSELSSRAPLAHFSRDNDELRPPQPIRSRPQVRVTTERARKKFGRKIQALRQQARLSHEDLSKESGITITKLKMIESGEAEPRLFTVISLAERLQTAAEELLEEDRMIPSPSSALTRTPFILITSPLLHRDRSYPKGAKAKRFGHAGLLPQLNKQPAPAVQPMTWLTVSCFAALLSAYPAAGQTLWGTPEPSPT